MIQRELTNYSPSSCRLLNLTKKWLYGFFWKRYTTHEIYVSRFSRKHSILQYILLSQYKESCTVIHFHAHWPPIARCSVCLKEERVRKRQRGTAMETKRESKCVCASVSSYQSNHSIQIQPKRVVSGTTIVGNMIFHYTLCKQCNLSVLPINMIDCGLSQEKSDTSGKKKFFQQSTVHSGCQRKWWLMCSRWVIPHPWLMKEESIIRTVVADVARTAIQVPGNNLLSFL